MDARPLLAALAITFLFWLILSWIRWDSKARMAQQSRQRLKDRLVNATLSERVGKRDTAALLAAASAQSISRSESAGSGTGDASVQQASDVALLRAQLEQAQLQAAAAEQNDLELRRLRGELESLQMERADTAKQIKALELRLQEQQAALDAADANASANDGLSEAGMHEPEQGHAPERDSGSAGTADLEASVSDSSGAAKGQAGQTPGKVLTPLYQAPSEKDNLKQIKGIGPVMERTLNALGVTTFQQLADFTQVDIDKVSEAIGAFPGRIERDDWVGKARQILQNKSPA